MLVVDDESTLADRSTAVVPEIVPFARLHPANVVAVVDDDVSGVSVLVLLAAGGPRLSLIAVDSLAGWHRGQTKSNARAQRTESAYVFFVIPVMQTFHSMNPVQPTGVVNNEML